MLLLDQPVLTSCGREKSVPTSEVVFLTGFIVNVL